MMRPLCTGIIGEGRMGSSIFEHLSGYSIPLRWLVSPEADIARIRQGFEKKLNRSLQYGLISPAEFEFRSKNLITKDIADLGDCDLIIEAIPENERMKQELFHALDGVAPPGCIFASNSSSILPGRLAPASERKKKTVGLHFFYPVRLKNIVEVIVTPQTDPAVIGILESFLDSIQRTYLLQTSSDAFILNRIFLEFQSEAYRIVQEGTVSELRMDELVRDSFFPHGVFDFFDSVGIDVILPSVKNYLEMSGETRHLPLKEKLEELSREGRLGIKTGEGFYRYENGRPSASCSAVPMPLEETERIRTRLQDSIDGAIHELSSGAGYSIKDLRTALNEYLGTDFFKPE